MQQLYGCGADQVATTPLTKHTQCEVYVEYFAYVNYFDHGFGSPLSEWSV